MSEVPKPSNARGSKDVARISREQRLAEALRANLRRRKALAKAEKPAPDAKQPPK